MSISLPAVLNTADPAIRAWLAAIRDEIDALTDAARDASARDRVYSKGELRRRIRRANRRLMDLTCPVVVMPE